MFCPACSGQRKSGKRLAGQIRECDGTDIKTGRLPYLFDSLKDPPVFFAKVLSFYAFRQAAFSRLVKLCEESVRLGRKTAAGHAGFLMHTEGSCVH